MVDPDTEAHVSALLERCTFGAPGPVTCAVSGGADSLALLVLATRWGHDVCAVHIDHGLRAESRSEADVVAAAAARFGADFEALAVDVEPGPNLESRARAARYGALPGGVLTGHTADDQAETVLLALLRGSSWHGLGGMEPSAHRPVLALRRAETHGLCAALGLVPVDDPSNADPTHRRNQVRHELLPMLTEIGERDPVPIIVRQAELLRQGGEIIAAAAAGLDPTDARAVAAADVIVAREGVRVWLWNGCGRDHPPDLATVDRVRAVAALEATGTDVGRGWRVERSQQRLRLVPPEAQDLSP